MEAIIEITEQMEVDYSLCNEDSDCDKCSCCVGIDDCIFNHVKEDQ